MTVMPSSIAAREPMRGPSSTEKIRAVAARFAPRLQRRVLLLSAASPRYADLLTSFPAAAVAIACRAANDRARQDALRLAENGAPLAHLAHALGLPLWLRKLPPEAITRPLTKGLPRAMREPGAGLRLLGAMPRAEGRPDRWLQGIIEAYAHGEEELAVWLAGQRLYGLRRPPPVPVRGLALYAHFSRRPELDAGRLVPRRWEPGLGLGRTAMLTRHWLQALLQELCVDPTWPDNTWCRVGAARDLEVVPLLASASIMEEGVAMVHCVGAYIPYVVHGQCRLYSLRRGGKRLATMELRQCQETGRPHINQIKLYRNGLPGPEVWEAAGEWLAERLREPSAIVAFRRGQYSDEALVAKLWLPFVCAMPAGSEVAGDVAPTVADIRQLMRELAVVEGC